MLVATYRPLRRSPDGAMPTEVRWAYRSVLTDLARESRGDRGGAGG